MVDYLRITSLAAQRVGPDLARWQVDHDFIELGDDWTETRKIRVFRSGPSLKGRGDCAYFPYGLDGSPPPPGPGCNDIYDQSWNEALDATWSRVTNAEFEAHFASPNIFDRRSPLTPIENVKDAPASAVYSHHKFQPPLRLPGGVLSDWFSEHLDGRILRRVERSEAGLLFRDNLYIQRRREFSIVFFNGSLAEGDAPPRFDESTIKIDRAAFETVYEAGQQKLHDVFFLQEPSHE